MSNVTVLCVRFGDKYGLEYVERLRNMVSRHLTVPYEFVCLTDSTLEIDGVRNIIQLNAGYSRPWWHKVHMFDPALSISGPVLYFDLDVVIHANVDKLVVTDPEQFYSIRDFNRKFQSSWNTINSSVISWYHGQQSHVWTEFNSNPTAAMKFYGDQDWIWHTSRKKLSVWPDEWIQSYKWEIRSKSEVEVVKGKRVFSFQNNNISLPADCCVTVFHGEPKPQDVTDKFVVDNWQ